MERGWGWRRELPWRHVPSEMPARRQGEARGPGQELLPLDHVGSTERG